MSEPVAHTVQPVDTNLDVDAQEAVEGDGSLLALWMPVILVFAGGGLAGHLLKAWSDSKSGVKKDIEEMRHRLERLSQRVQRLEHTGSRKGRIAHLALDRVQDWEAYFLRRDETRNQKDPDHSATAWVPEPLPHLKDESWVSKQRSELLQLDDPDE